MNWTEISQRLAGEAETIASMLLPNGKKKGAEWCVGSIDGEEGDSLKVRLNGNKAGVWRDFASDIGGDLLDSWRDGDDTARSPGGVVDGPATTHTGADAGRAGRGIVFGQR